MITLFSGVPGTGKTAAMVALLRKLPEDRPLYVFGLAELRLAHVPLDDPKRWPELVPDGAAIFIDEVQDVWRPRGSAAAVPPHIAALETHRHRGLDFFLTTQRPGLLDANVRALVGRHVHIRDLGVLGRKWYEWPECCDSPQTGWKTAPVRKSYKLPKEVFPLYKSASLHVKPLRSIPPALYFAGVGALALAGLAYIGYRSITAKIDKHGPDRAASAPAVLPGNMVRPGQAPSTGYAEAFVPRALAYPESAPAFDHLRQVTAMPRVVGGYCVGDACRCFTQQGTDPGIGDVACRKAVHFPRFDPYRQAQEGYAASPQRPASAGL